MSFTIAISVIEPFGCKKPSDIGDYSALNANLPAGAYDSSSCMVGVYPTSGKNNPPWYKGLIPVYYRVARVNPPESVLKIDSTAAVFSPFKFHNKLFRDGWNAVSVYAANKDGGAAQLFDTITNDMIAKGQTPEAFVEQVLILNCLAFQEIGKPVYLPLTMVNVIPENVKSITDITYLTVGGNEISYDEALAKVGGFSPQPVLSFNNITALVNQSELKFLGGFTKAVACLIQNSAISAIAPYITKDMLVANWNIVSANTVMKDGLAAPIITPLPDLAADIVVQKKKSNTGLYIGLGVAGLLTAGLITIAVARHRNKVHHDV